MGGGGGVFVERGGQMGKGHWIRGTAGGTHLFEKTTRHKMWSRGSWFYWWLSLTEKDARVGTAPVLWLLGSSTCQTIRKHVWMWLRLITVKRLIKHYIIYHNVAGCFFIFSLIKNFFCPIKATQHQLILSGFFDLMDHSFTKSWDETWSRWWCLWLAGGRCKGRNLNQQQPEPKC